MRALYILILRGYAYVVVVRIQVWFVPRTTKASPIGYRRVPKQTPSGPSDDQRRIAFGCPSDIPKSLWVISSAVEYLVYTESVSGSNPLLPSINFF